MQARAASLGLFFFNDHGNTGDIARSDHHWKSELKLSVVIPDGLLVLDFNRNPFAGTDVGDRGGKDVGPLLFDQTGAFSLLFGLLIDLLTTLTPLFDLSLDDPFPDSHPEMVDRRRFRKREDIDALGPTRLFHGWDS